MAVDICGGIMERNKSGKFVKKTGSYVIKIGLRLDEDYGEKLKQVAESQEKTLAELTRQIVEEWLDKTNNIQR